MSIQTDNLKRFDISGLRRKLSGLQGKGYWRGLDELAESEEFLDYLRHEFPAEAETWTDPVGRRKFLQLMGASMAFAGLTACTRQPDERIVPYVRAPEQIIPGKPLFFATAIPQGGYGVGILVESHDGRPTKVEGNPRHPASLGAANVWAQASVLDLYDPDRLRAVMNRGRVRTWDAFEAELETEIVQLRLNRGRGLRILSGPFTSPSMASLADRLRSQFPEAGWHQYEAAAGDAAREATLRVFGRPMSCHFRMDRASVICSLDSDFLFNGPAAVRYTKDFSPRRKGPEGTDSMNRLYMVESSPTVTGTLADHRIVVPPSQVERVARLLAYEIGLDLGGARLESGPHSTWIAGLAKDLQAHRGASAVVPGEYEPPAVHAIAYAINEHLGNTGSTFIVTEPVESRPVIQQESIRQLADDIGAGEVDVLVILGGNPVFDAPSDLQFEGLVGKPRLSAHLTSQLNETSAACRWALPESHFLEAWGDVRAFDGSVSVVQPLIEPLYSSRSAVELLATILGESARSGYEIVRQFWAGERQGPGFEAWWRSVLHAGVVADSAFPPVEGNVNRQAIAELVSGPPDAPREGLEVMFRPDPSILDGRFANNGWLQELPKPLTKLTWDNAVLISPSLAEQLGVTNSEVVRVALGDRSITGPVWIQPGHPDASVTLHLGYGRSEVGRIGREAGFNAFVLRSSGMLWAGSGAEIVSTGEADPLACTQTHYSMEGRDLVRVLSAHEEAHGQGEHGGAEVSLYPPFEYDTGYAWGMAVDLSCCTGCNACVVACQAENNIAIVGKDQVANGREMHWIRIDRYYAGDLDQPDVVHQPVMCQHCENAPCESVCPVAATVHSEEGLNEMVYNRCVGTRYCANNCPYKVRRFNFLLYSDWDTESLKLQRNPNVTVRSRGVMEKCTYCVQRISAAKIQSELEGREVRDGEIKTACQQTCPADAIVFGNLNDPESAVAKLRADQRNYGILTEFNTKPRTTYLARLRNENKEIEA